MRLTSGIELTTAITNVVIYIVSLYGFFAIKKDKLWKFFYFLMTIDSFLGVIVHGLEMSIQLNVLLWLILAITFTITVNTFLVIFLKIKARYIILFSILLSLLLLAEIHHGMDFILTFTLYVLLSIIISTYKIVKSKINNKEYFLAGILVQITGGILMLSKVSIGEVNHNGIYHLFMALTLAIFLIGIKKNSK